MVRAVRKRGKTVYVWEMCGFSYGEKMWAEKCEVYCAKYHSCSLEITSHAVARAGGESRVSKDF